MKTQHEVLRAIIDGKKSSCVDGRDYVRLSDFFPVRDWIHLGVTLNEGEKEPTVRTWSRENIIEQLRTDVEFGFDKALNRRGISAGLMYEVVKMWMWVLDDELEAFTGYIQYGLPLFKAVALKYGFKNPIGKDTGSESKYAA